MDYMALFKITAVPYKFPISMIEVMSDELAGAAMFSKLDLKIGSQKMEDEEFQ